MYQKDIYTKQDIINVLKSSQLDVEYNNHFLKKFIYYLKVNLNLIECEFDRSEDRVVIAFKNQDEDLDILDIAAKLQRDIKFAVETKASFECKLSYHPMVDGIIIIFHGKFEKTNVSYEVFVLSETLISVNIVCN